MIRSQGKPEVTFAEIETLIDVHGGQIARLRGVRHHPLLGNPPVVDTSLVKRIAIEHGVVIAVETRNTRYVREERHD